MNKSILDSKLKQPNESTSDYLYRMVEEFGSTRAWLEWKTKYDPNHQEIITKFDKQGNIVS